MYNDLSPESRVWIYQSNRQLSNEESQTIQGHLDNFCQQWTSHNNQLKAGAKVLNGLFLVLMADESQAGASGCSIDKSVHFMKSLEQHLGINLFDRMTFAFEQDGSIELADRASFAQYFQDGKISNETVVFDTLVKTKAEFEESFRKPLESSWHQRFV